MKFLTLRNREISLDVSSSRYPIKSREASRSKGQFHLGQQLSSLYPDQVLEEFTIPDSRLSLDFYIPLRRIAFEFQGKQHDSFNILFHNSEMDFVRQKSRDNDKRRWCEMNGITLVEIRNAKISLEQLREVINGAILND